jgi:prephenate dehydrogenase
MQTIRVSILGLGRVGASFGLALRRCNARKDARQRFEVIGFDPDERVSTRARALGACETTARTAAAAAANRQIVILTLPLHESEAVWSLIGGVMQPGTVVIDTSPFRQPALAWAKKYAHEEVHPVGAAPIVNARYLFDGLDDLEHAAEDYFDDGVLLISPDPRADRDAVQLVTDLAALIGAQARFTDPAEHDSWVAVMEALPALIGVVAFEAISSQSHWDDTRRIGNPAFGQLTHHLLEMHPDALRDLLLRDRERLIRQIDAFSETLAAVRAVLAANDRAAVEALLIRQQTRYHEWLARRRRHDWDPLPDGARAAVAETLMTSMFGSAIAKRLTRRDKDE